jgi:putative transposase
MNAGPHSGHRKLCRRYDVPGDAHCLTFSCFRRLPLLGRDRSRRWMLDALNLGRSQGKYDLWAYVIMPEHVHVVLLPHREATIAGILTTLRQSVSKRALVWLRQHAPAFLAEIEDLQPNGDRAYRFWQRGGGYDRNLRTVTDIYEKIDYVHDNPVRRGLVTSPEAWPWSSCLAWQTGEDKPLGLDRGSLPTRMPEEG